MEPHCCARCRLLQPPSPACRLCGHAAPQPLLDISTARVEGLLPISRAPDGELERDRFPNAVIALLCGGALALASRSLAGFGAAPVIGWFLLRGRPRVKEPAWRQRLEPIAPPRPPAAPRSRLVGVAERLERTLGEGHRAALLIATEVHEEAGLLVRGVEAVPFWLVVGGRRVLISGAAWAHDPRRPPAHGGAYLDQLGCPELPVSRKTRRRLRGARTVIRPGDRIAIHGELREEQLPIVTGYRDSLGETLRGEPGAPLWIEKLAPDELGAPDPTDVTLDHIANDNTPAR